MTRQRNPHFPGSDSYARWEASAKAIDAKIQEREAAMRRRQRYDSIKYAVQSLPNDAKGWQTFDSLMKACGATGLSQPSASLAKGNFTNDRGMFLMNLNMHGSERELAAAERVMAAYAAAQPKPVNVYGGTASASASDEAVEYSPERLSKLKENRAAETDEARVAWYDKTIAAIEAHGVT